MSLLQDAYPRYRQQRLRQHAAGRQSHNRWHDLTTYQGGYRSTSAVRHPSPSHAQYFRMSTMVAWRSFHQRPITCWTAKPPNGLQTAPSAPITIN